MVSEQLRSHPQLESLQYYLMQIIYLEFEKHPIYSSDWG